MTASGGGLQRLLCEKQTLSPRAQRADEYFGLDENHMVYAGIALGWPDPQEPANKLYADRAPLSEVVESKKV